MAYSVFYFGTAEDHGAKITYSFLRIMASNKRYGLILPEKVNPKKPIFQASHNVFGDDSESEDDTSKKPVLLRPSYNVNRQAKVTQEKAVLEDPTVYQYDEIYDTMTLEKEKKTVKNKEEKKPKYIENLLKSANKRKIENERRVERQIQKEREKEGEEFADKEVFVTSAYKKKLEELKLEEEKEKREEYLESIGDVTKQKDLGGFYRHLYEQRLGSDKVKEKSVEDNKAAVEKSLDGTKDKKANKKKVMSTKRNYRKRKLSVDNSELLSEGEIEDSEEEINRLKLEDIKDIRSAKKSKAEENIDADSDFSIDDSSDEDTNSKAEDNIPPIESKDLPEEKTKKVEPVYVTEIKKDKSPTDSLIKKDDNIPTVQKVDIWKKRTVGDIFDQALIKYYERKSARGW